MEAYRALFGQKQDREFKKGTGVVYEKLQKQYRKTPEGKAAKKEQKGKPDLEKADREAAKTGRTQKVREAIAKSHGVEPDRITLTGNGRYSLSPDVQPARNDQRGR